MLKLKPIDEHILKLIPAGSDNRITSSEIVKITRLANTSNVRASINRLRANFHPICSDKKGYFLAMKSEDIDHTIASLNSRIYKMIMAREGIKKMQKVMEAQAHNE